MDGERVEDLNRSVFGKVCFSMYLTKKLTSSDWENAETVMKLLKPLKEATEATNKDKYPTLSKMMPYFDQLLDHFTSLEENDSDAALNNRRNGQFLPNEHRDNVIYAAEAAKGKVQKYFEVSSDLAIVATILDPRFRMEYYRGNGSAEDTTYSDHLAVFQRYYQEYNVATSEEDAADRTDKVAFLKFFQSKPTSKKDEFTRYIDGELLASSDDPLIWWNANKCSYPRLAEMAQDMLAIPATSATSERVFSGGRLVMPFNRTRLESDAMKALMCLRNWVGDRYISGDLP
jgi:hypothetical protein